MLPNDSFTTGTPYLNNAGKNIKVAILGHRGRQEVVSGALPIEIDYRLAAD